jgi:N-acetylmuramoyl-L-alanine amidase
MILAVPLEGFAQGRIEQVTVIGPRGRQGIPVSQLAGVSMVPLDELNRFLGSSIHTAPDSASATFSVGGRSAKVSSGRSLVPVEGKLILLSAPITSRAGRWFVPLDFLEKVLPLVSRQRITYEEDSRLLVLGEGFPHLTVRSFPYPAYTRIVLEASSPVDYQVTQAGAQVRVSMPVAYMESDFSTEELQDGVVDRITLGRQGEGYVLLVNLGDRYGTLKAFELDSPSRMVLDLFRSRVPTDAEIIRPPTPGQELPTDNAVIPVPPPRPKPIPDPPARADVRPGVLKTITLDPGHGGSETGATGRNGLQEKDVTLAVAHRLHRLLENRLGIRVLLTRDTDSYLSLDERTALANNNKSDLFLSIHANASPRQTARGSEVYFLSYEASDEEARRLAASENANGFERARSRGDTDLEFILWDMAQAAYLNESATLAELLQDELQANRADDKNRGIKQAPFRVLMGATMPSALIEIGFITNPDEERRLGSTEYQDQLARAIFRGLVKYKERFERKLSVGGGSPSGQRP